MTPKFECISNLGGPLEQFLVDKFASEGVPEGHNVESVHSGEQVILLFPREIVVRSCHVFQLHSAIVALYSLHCS